VNSPGDKLYGIDAVCRGIVGAGEAIYRLNIHDVDDGEVKPLITDLFGHVPFWHNWLLDPQGGGCPHGYTRPPDPDYCGHYYATAIKHAANYIEPGVCLDIAVDPNLCLYVFPGTDRIAAAHKWEQAGYDRPDELAPSDIRAGYLVLVRPTRAKPFGSHIVIPREAPDHNGNFRTYEANATGIRADGSIGKGVVMNERNVEEVATVHAPDLSWFSGSALQTAR